MIKNQKCSKEFISDLRSFINNGNIGLKNAAISPKKSSRIEKKYVFWMFLMIILIVFCLVFAYFLEFLREREILTKIDNYNVVF